MLVLLRYCFREDKYNDNDVRKRDADQKRKMKHHADKKMRLPKKQIDVGDQVLVRQNKVN